MPTTVTEQPDAVARATCAEIALLDRREGPVAAANLIRDRWSALGTGSACFVEDMTRPAWLVGIALRAGDIALARRTLRAVERLAAGEHPVTLSPREEEIARLVGQGLTNQQVARRLGLSPHTVNFHLRNIFRKLSISTRVALARAVAQRDATAC